MNTVLKTLILLVFFFPVHSPLWATGTLPVPAIADATPDAAALALSYNTPGGAHSALPLGNGDIGAQAWIEPSGDLIMLIGKTDAWSEHGILLKLGKLRVKLDTPISTDKKFLRQTLDMGSGTLRIESVLRDAPDCRVALRLWVDANHPAIHMDVTAAKPVGVKTALEPWRTQVQDLKGWNYFEGFSPEEPARLYPDTIVPPCADGALKEHLVWYYRNKQETIYPVTLKLQGLQDFKGANPLLNRMFGCAIGGPGLMATSPMSMVSAKPATRHALSIHPLTMQAQTSDAWTQALADLVMQESARDKEACYAAHAAWWRTFWIRSWIHVAGGKPEDAKEIQNINTGLSANRYLVACAARGAFPVKFNGSIFNLPGIDNVGRVHATFTPDFRNWGAPFWFQNQRHIYWPMIQAGDFEQLLPFFRMYRDMLPLAKYRVRTYYGHNGALFPETQYPWGAYSLKNYGWNRSGKELGLTDNGFVRRYWQGGIELSAMMLEWYRHTQDDAVFADTILPVISEVATFYDEHYKRDAAGKIRFYPAQILESIWDAENPMPEIAGLKATLAGLLAVPERLTTETQRQQWRRMLDELPPLPRGEIKGKPVLKDAVSIRGGRHNMENAQLYAVWPYHLYGKGMPDYELALETYFTRPIKFGADYCWHNDIIWAACLGLPNEARHGLGSRFVFCGAFRFPAMYINGDWPPDHDNGSVCQNTLQKMLMQTVDDRILLLPAWPKDWDVNFKLHAPKQTTVECELRDGKVTNLVVTPESRRKDVEICLPFELKK